MEIRLQKFLAQCGIASRRNSEKLILEGLVQINGKIEKELGIKIDPEKDGICFKGKKLSFFDDWFRNSRDCKVSARKLERTLLLM